MKKHILITAFVLISSITYSQSSKKTLFTKHDLITKFHTIEDLEDLGKGTLVKIYMKRIQEIAIVMPFMAITTKADRQLDEVGIRENPENLKLLAKHKESQLDHIATNNEIISEFTAYADSDNIVWAILYAEDIIKKLRLGFKGNF